MALLLNLEAGGPCVVERSTETPGSRGTMNKGPAVDFQGSVGTPETARRKKNLPYSC